MLLSSKIYWQWDITGQLSLFIVKANMHVNEIRDVLSSISYKRGHALRTANVFGSLSIELEVSVIDVDDNSKRTTVYLRRETPPNLSRDKLIAFVFQMIQEFELHESKEWFKINGVRYEEPHPELQRVL